MPQTIVTPSMCIRSRTLLHDLDRAGRAAHHPRPQAGEVEAPELGLLELGDEHGRHAVERGAALVLDRLEHGAGLERLAGDDQARTVHHAGEAAEHHAEAVVERHRHAHPVELRVVQYAAREVGVVDDVVVRERRALGEARGARRVLDVDGLIRTKARLALDQLVRAQARAGGQELLPVVLEHDDLAHLRAFAMDVEEHAEVVRVAEAARHDEHADTGLAEGIGQLGRLVGRIDRDEDRTRRARRRVASRPTRSGWAPRCRRGRPWRRRGRARRVPRARPVAQSSS